LGGDQMVMLFCIVSSASVTNFFPTVVQTLNYGRVESLLLTVPLRPGRHHRLHQRLAR
jgi:hypothetical protein